MEDEDFLTSDSSASGDTDLDHHIHVEEEQEEERSDEWRRVTRDTDARAHALPEFRGTPGLHPDTEAPAEADGNESAFLGLFLTDELCEKVRDWTNRGVHRAVELAEQEQGGPDEGMSPLLTSWRDCTVEEIKKTIGTVLYMDLDRKPELHLYWSANSLYHCP